MRIAYREHLDAFAHDLIIMCDMVREIMVTASDALLRGSLESAENALSLLEGLDEVRTRCSERAVDLLALEGPLARDLRQVISSIYIVEDFDRMAALAMHVARTARDRHPEHVLPAGLEEYFGEFSRLVEDMTDKTRSILVQPDPDLALRLAREDDAVDDLANRLMAVLTQEEWPHSTREAVDAALLVRFYERYADRCVNVGARIVYLSTGLRPGEYLAKQARDQAGTDPVSRSEDLGRQGRRNVPGVEW